MQAYHHTVIDTVAFHLRLLELLAVACHQIAVSLYLLDDAIHGKSEQEALLADDTAAVPDLEFWKRRRLPSLTFIYNAFYHSFEQNNQVWRLLFSIIGVVFILLYSY